MPGRLADAWSRQDPAWQRPVNEVADRALTQLADRLARWELLPTGTEGWRKAEVTAGGVDTRELSSQTLECARQPGLYFIGDVVDNTGWLGGCVALVDNDLGGTGCAGKVEAAQQCEWAACTGGCPIDIDDPTLRAKSAAAFADCVAAAKTGACATYVSAAACADDAKYASCMFTDETQTVSAYGTLFCSAPDDGGTTADAGDGG